MNKITLLLDFDGVLATVKQFALTPKSKSWIVGDFFNNTGIYPFDKKCVKILNEILNKFDCDIVVSSDWKLYNNIEQLQEIFNINGVNGNIVDVTPNHPISISYIEMNRAAEILKYVEDNKINKWLAIDDLDLRQWLEEKNFAMCFSDFEGIKQSGLKKKIINKLNKL